LPSTLAILYLASACALFTAAKHVIPVPSSPRFIKQTRTILKETKEKLPGKCGMFNEINNIL
jgi:hypothetical protein